TLPHDKADFAPAEAKQPLTLAVLAAMVLVMAFGIVPAVTAILGAAVILVLTRCVPMTSVYDVIDWPTIVLIAGMIPLALALQKTGIIGEVGNVFMDVTSGLGPIGILAGLFLITTALGCVMSNTPVAVLLAPMVMHVSEASGISPQACVMVVAIACSAAFISPFGSPVLLLVREPGEYSLGDYLKTGVPLMLCTLPITLCIVWLMYL
ncbi:anion permease, partial [Desulfovibrio sp. OttesenSCG-928-G15]|nr:anion permease [Desulfovibrio sp. OttesenSCG-928-G15]